MKHVRAHALIPLIAVLHIALVTAAALADVSVTLKNSFITAQKNRATMEAEYTVVKSHHKPKPAKDDGDIQCAGTVEEIGLACVAEVMNARNAMGAVTTFIAHEGGSPVHVVGVWRVWPEHATGSPEFVQGADVDPIVSTNPPHVFELHPLVQVGTHDVRDTFRRVKGYKYKDAATAFARFESMPCRIEPGPFETTFTTNQIGYNYVAFTMELLEEPTHELDDKGVSVYASVPSKDPEVPYVSKVRCVFVDGTTPEERVLTLHAGDRLRVVGMPRVSLALLWYRVQQADERPSLLTRSLPYEMVIVALLEH